MLLLVVVCGKRQEVGQRPGSSSVQCLLDASFGHDHNGYKYNTNMDHRHHWMMTIIPDDARQYASSMRERFVGTSLDFFLQNCTV